MTMRSLALAFLSTLALVTSSHSEQAHRQLLGLDIPFEDSTDVCKVNVTETGENVYGDCVPEVHFPTCDENNEFICFNRVNRRDLFYEDKQPHYYIDPNRVLCYDQKMLDNGGGCSSCTPGRYCLSEGRCIMDDVNYDCTEWWSGVATSS